MTIQTMLSAIQPTHYPHLGNYLGAIKPWVKMQDTYHSFCFVVDLHAITVPQEPEVLRKNTYEAVAFYLAAGLDPAKVTLFVQSHVREHAELAWILTCHAHMGELSRMTQFKDKSQKSGQAIGVGLYSYPILMAADILLYQPDVIPVGEDQKQHVELTRDLAIRINGHYQKNLFRVPKPLIPESGAKIKDLQDPTAKMSKSAVSHAGVIFLNETDKVIEKKVKSATTDSGDRIEASMEKPGILNLLHIQSALTSKSLEDLEKSYEGKMYGHLKLDTAELIIQEIRSIRDEAARLFQDKPYLESVLKAGAQKATIVADKTLTSVYEAVGLIRLR